MRRSQCSRESCASSSGRPRRPCNPTASVAGDERSEPTLRPLPAPAAAETTAPTEPAHPGFLARHRRAIVTAIGALAVVGFVYFVIPQIAGLGPTLRRLRSGDVRWLALGVLLETVSIGGEVAYLCSRALVKPSW
jgi:hypothetical protein